MAEVSIALTVNGRPVELTVPTDLLLVDLLRDRLGLTGTKESCGVGVCGACTVLVDDQPVSSCLMLAVMADGRQVWTIEGLAQKEGCSGLLPLQEAFIACEGLQCGICTPGQVMAAYALLKAHPQPTREDIAEWMAGNLCRCTGYLSIIRAIQTAAGLPVEDHAAV